MAAWLSKLRTELDQPTSGLPVFLFRVLFGVLNFGDYVYRFASGEYRLLTVDPVRFFPFEAFRWLPQLSGPARWIPGAVILISSAFIALGIRTRLASAIFGVTYLYLTLLEQAYFNNHYYLIALLGLLLAVVDSGKGLRPPGWIPKWQLRILQFQFALVYFYAGVAKFDVDWRNGAVGATVFGGLCRLLEGTVVCEPDNYENVTRIMSYLGQLFDLYIGFLLFSPRYRRVALLLVLAFHTSNLFFVDNIGVFPYLGMASTLLFVDFSRFRVDGSPRAFSTAKPIRALIAGYVLFQLLFPLRTYLYPMRSTWTDQGQHFAWRMKTYAKILLDFRLELTDARSSRTKRIQPEKDGLSGTQTYRVLISPTLFMQYVQWQRQKAIEEGFTEPRLRADICLEFNRRTPQRFVDPAVNLMDQNHSIHVVAPYRWILPVLDETTPPEIRKIAECRQSDYQSP